MKEVKVTFTEDIFEELKEALRWDGKERSAYVFCKSIISEERAKLIPFKVKPLSEHEYETRSAGHYSITKAAVDHSFNEAIDTQSDIIQCHIHPGDPGHFSGIDKIYEPRFMRHIAEGINGIIHASIVFGNSMETIDAWFYDRETEKVKPVQKIVVIKKNGIDIYVPPRSRIKRKVKSIDSSRTEQAFGKEAVAKLSLIDVGVIGASGIGAPIIEMVARDNFNSVIISDMDSIEASNLNRLPGTTRSDIGKNKAEHYAEYARRINPVIDVRAYNESVYEEKVQKAFGWADIVFGAVDSGARLSMNRMCLASLTPYFDFGAGVVAGKDGPEAVGGQLYSIIPGREACLSCAQVFNSLESEFLDQESRAIEEKQGYIKGIETTAPLVMFLDYLVAGHGYYKALQYLWATGNPSTFSTHIDAQTGLYMETQTDSQGCIWCQKTGYLGKGDEVPMLVPRKDKPLPSIYKQRSRKKEDIPKSNETQGIGDHQKKSEEPSKFAVEA